MAEEFEKGDRVEWNSHGGKAVGTVQRKTTSDGEAGGRKGEGLQGGAAVSGQIGEVRWYGRAQAERAQEALLVVAQKVIPIEPGSDEAEQVRREFGDNVNMTRSELEKWLETDEAKAVGQ